MSFGNIRDYENRAALLDRRVEAEEQRPSQPGSVSREIAALTADLRQDDAEDRRASRRTVGANTGTGFSQPLSERAVAEELERNATLLGRLASMRRRINRVLLRVGPTLRFTAVGDVTMGSEGRLPADNGRGLFELVREPLQNNADITFANLETVVGDDLGTSYKQRFFFGVPARFAETLRAAGLDVVSVANNHAGDYGQRGRAATRKALRDQGIDFAGPTATTSWQHRGLRVGLIAFATSPVGYRVQNIEEAREVVSQVASEHDIVIVSMHAGAEGRRATRVPEGTETFMGENRGNLRAFTHAAIDSGADLVVGHGPHVLRGMEVYRNRLIAYSLGNFSSHGNFSLRGDSAVSVILNTTLGPNGEILDAGLTPVVLEGHGAPRVDPCGKGISQVRERSEQDFGAPLFDASGVWQGNTPGDTSED
jgi:poly-gamma-glutamate capsule biosynthesis protein CapA/YwtB (metallophosphatase superfamily)